MLSDEQRQRLRDLLADAQLGQAVRIPADIMVSVNEAMRGIMDGTDQELQRIRQREHRLRNLPVPYPFRHGAYDE